ncbi:sorbitol dehydrogenase [Spathaspora passalidarum NRRL Y-27907]|uniref:Sorbitol dehydrogenase n=1 Tax=Spathaspora passalidarum (strain NRRL Y-27907 / 11-Y1) TaxID=619300 RepID=G3AHP5_SPAPN|nr:sorbitol dehydrogenase [Spathaspora passalidarum NRRL Y-27907]EGW34210.1 sorbitol dehydrogenase [Spathaspora passalidarum NRRL Y-27907]
MKAVEYHGPGNLRFVKDRQEPQIVHPHDVKIKVKYVGICSPDVKEYKDSVFFKDEVDPLSKKKKKGQVMGHEVSGKIVEVGPEVKDLKVGQYVVLEANGHCHDKKILEQNETSICDACAEGCYNCCQKKGYYGLGFSDGGMAEYLVVGDAHVVPYPENIIPPDVATLMESLAVSWHGVRTSRITEEKPADRSALVIGGGPIGLSTVLALRGQNVDKIVVSEPEQTRREVAEKLGAKVFDPTNRTNSTDDLIKLSEENLGYSYVYDCSGRRDSFDTMLSCVKPGGVATNLTMSADKTVRQWPMTLTKHECIFKGSTSYVREDFKEIISAFEGGVLDPKEVSLLISDKKNLEEGVDAISHLANTKKDVKILLAP